LLGTMTKPSLCTVKMSSYRIDYGVLGSYFDIVQALWLITTAMNILKLLNLFNTLDRRLQIST